VGNQSSFRPNVRPVNKQKVQINILKMKKEQKMEQQHNSDSADDNSHFQPTCPKPIVSRSSLSKREQMSLLSADICSVKISRPLQFDAESNLCAVIRLLSKGTRYEYDANEIIKAVCPKYFE
jgi:hypothetical protein